MLQHTGVIIKIGETQHVTETFAKREFVLEDGSQYPQKVQFEFSQDKCDLLDQFKEGDLVTVNFNLRGRSWVNPQGEEKFFNTLSCWKIEAVHQETPAAAPILPVIQEGEDDSDLPF